MLSMTSTLLINAQNRFRVTEVRFGKVDDISKKLVFEPPKQVENTFITMLKTFVLIGGKFKTTVRTLKQYEFNKDLEGNKINSWTSLVDEDLEENFRIVSLPGESYCYFYLETELTSIIFKVDIIPTE